jgi:hypothetical protein
MSTPTTATTPSTPSTPTVAPSVAPSTPSSSGGDIFSNLIPGLSDTGSQATENVKVTHSGDVVESSSTSSGNQLPKVNPPKDGKTTVEKEVTDTKADYNDFRKKMGLEEIPSSDDAADPSSDKEEIPSEKEVPQSKKAKTVEVPSTPQVDKTPRDYSGFSEEEASLLQRMSNESFNKFAPELKAAKALREEYANYKKETEEKLTKNAPPVIVDPNGYTESDEYKRVTQENVQYDQIYRHYLSQLGAVRQGQTTYKDLTTDAQGNIVAVDVPVDATADAKIMDMIQQTSAMFRENQQKLGSIQNEWKTKQEELPRLIQNIIKQNFADKIPQDDPQIKTANEFIARVGHTKNPLAPLIGYLFAGLMKTQQALREVTDKQQKLSVNNEVEKRVEPAPKGNFTQKITSGDPSKIANYDDYRKMMGLDN